MAPHGTVAVVLLLPSDILELMVAHCLDGYPLEACGLLAGLEDIDGGASLVTRGYQTTNAAASSRVYTVAPAELLRADRDAQDHGSELIGVWHSHTHTEAYPSPTDIAQAPDPAWHYVIVSLRDVEPVLRSYRVAEGSVSEEQVEVQ